MDSLVTLHRKRWREKGIVTSFEDARFVDFHREMATLALKRGWLRLFQLQIGDQTIAAAYRFRYRDVYYAYQTAFDPDWFRYGPGNLMTSHVVQQAIQEGAREFDWCRGPEEYKSSWGSKVRADSHLLLSTSWRGTLSLVGAKIADAGRSIGRRLLSPPLRRKLGHFLTQRRW
jgi:CelD/BcsL family acetyltransferase involved in cellulose biosynthesis